MTHRPRHHGRRRSRHRGRGCAQAIRGEGRCQPKGRKLKAWLSIGALAMLLAGCVEPEGPVFMEVHFPKQAYRGDPPIEILAEVSPGGAEVSTVELVPVDLSESTGGELATSASLAMSEVGGHRWRGFIGLPGSGDLAFVLRAEDESGASGAAPDLPEGDRIDGAGPPVFVVRLLERPRSEPSLCDHVRCRPGEACNPRTGLCVPETSCLLPGNTCARGYSCDEATGVCVSTDPCAACPPDTSCRDGLCVPDPGGLCALCLTNDDCRAGALCIVYPDGSRGCGRDCTSAPCPEGFVCRGYGEGVSQCTAEEGSCSR